MSKFLTTDDDYDAEPEELSTPEEDFDVIVKYPVVGAASLLEAHLIYDKGLAHPDHSHMYVVDRAFKEIACGTGRYAGRVTYKGIADTARPQRFELDTYGERSTYENVITPSLPGVPTPTDISQPRFGLTVRYLSTTRPDTSLVGTNLDPPDGPGGAWDVPENAFASSPDVILAFPWGWVLEKRTGPNLPGREVWFVEDSYVYYLQWRPNG
jgi:hypothetical protein